MLALPWIATVASSALPRTADSKLLPNAGCRCRGGRGHCHYRPTDRRRSVMFPLT